MLFSTHPMTKWWRSVPHFPRPYLVQYPDQPEVQILQQPPSVVGWEWPWIRWRPAEPWPKPNPIHCCSPLWTCRRHHFVGPVPAASCHRRYLQPVVQRRLSRGSYLYQEVAKALHPNWSPHQVFCWAACACCVRNQVAVAVCYTRAHR